MPRTRTFVILLLTVFTVCGCATAPPRLPTRGEDVTEGVNSDIAEQALRHLFTECRPSFVTARALVRGTRDRRHVVGSLWMGVDATTSSVRLESMDTGSPRFALFGSDTLGPNGKDEATLLLSGGQWVVRSSSRDLVELVLGVPLSALELKGVLTGCPVAGGDFRTERFDADTIKFTFRDTDAAVEVFMRRRSVGSPWVVFAMTGTVPGRPIRWRADMGERTRGVLDSVRVTSLEWNGRLGRQFDLTASFDRIQTPALTTGTLSLRPSESAETVSLEAVRSNLALPLLAN